MKDSDVHSGWKLGTFCITGYTRQQTMNDGGEYDGCPLFIKNVGDTISLSFRLDQDINALDGKDNVFISEDTNGYDTYFGIPKEKKTNFGKGTLLVKKIDYHHEPTYVEPYVDYLNGVEKGAETKVEFFEEGDYEVALDYEIRKNNIDVWKIKTAPSYTNYQIKIKFSVRNGNCMVYPKDVKTDSELVNTSFTENGFYLDMARSRYLQLDVKKLNLVESEGTLVEDVRFNKPATDGEKFTDEGVYVITVKNIYTKRETEKKIYVGSDPILKAYVTTGKDVEYIKEMVAAGATIDEDGMITLPTNEVIEDETEEVPVEKEPKEVTVEENTEREEVVEEEELYVNPLPIVCIALIIIIVVFVVFIIRDKRKNLNRAYEEEAKEMDDKKIIEDIIVDNSEEEGDNE